MDFEKPHRLCIIEDEEEMRDMYRSTVDDSFEISEFDSATAACEKIDVKNPPDIFLSDLVMPRMSGLQLLEWIRERGINSPFIILSGQAQKDDAINALKLGAFAFLEKPFDPLQLFVTLNRASANIVLRQLRSELTNLNRNMLDSLKNNRDSLSDELQKSFDQFRSRADEIETLQDRYNKLYQVLQAKEES